MRALAVAALAVLAAVTAPARRTVRLAPPPARPRAPRCASTTSASTIPRMAAEVVRGLLSPEGRVYPDPAQHRLVVSDRPDVHARVAEALRTLNGRPRATSGSR